MTLEEMKQKVYALIEEYNEDADDLTDDEDLATKMNTVINQIQNELIRYKKIPAYTSKEVKEGDEISLKDIDSMIYQLNNIRGVSYDTMDDRITFEEDGTAKIYYYKYPTKIDMDTDDDYTFELSTDLLEIMPYGVAADLLKSDVSSQYGSVYAARYREMLQMLDPRFGTGVVELSGGIEV
jgi:hypothetical protein